MYKNTKILFVIALVFSFAAVFYATVLAGDRGLGAEMWRGMTVVTENKEEKERAEEEKQQREKERIEREQKEQVNQKIEEILSGMTLNEKVGQMFLGGCPMENAVDYISSYHLGGFIFFARDFQNKNPEDIRGIVENFQKASKIKMLISADEEGGTVNRISKYKAFRQWPFASPQELYKIGGFETIEKDTLEKCQLLKSLGFNLNLAPVCDVSTNPVDYIYPRSFGQDPTNTAIYIKTVVSVMKAERVGSSLKHFPGYGNSQDSHKGLVYDERSYESFVQSDFLPFIAGIEAGAGSVLMTHNVVTSMDRQRPASLSPKVHEILRKELNFDGVILTDDLSMGGIKNFASDEEAAILAVLAGNDMLCSTNFINQWSAVIGAVGEGKITEERINESVKRILRWKLELGLLQ